MAEEIVIATDRGEITAPIQAGGNSLSDSTKMWRSDVFVNYLVKVTRHGGWSEFAVIMANSRDSLVIRGAWSLSFPAGSVYEIIPIDLMQAMRDVFGGGSNISAANPLETHDPEVGDVEDKLDHPTYGLAALKAALDSLAGGAFYGSYGPKNVEVDNDVDFGIILYDPSGNIITTGEITPGTYTVHRVRGAVDTEIVAATASSEAAGRVYMTYNFPAADWQVGDIFYIIFSGITVTIDGVTTEYPDLYIWGRVVRELDISGKVDAVEAKLDDGTTGLAAIKTVVDAILVDTSTTLENKLDAIKTVVDAILVDTGTTLEGKLDALALVCTEARLAELDAGNIPTDLATITAYVDELEARLSAVRAGYLDRIKNLTRPQNGTQATTNALAVVGAAIEDTVPFKVSGLLSLHNMQAGDTFLVIEEIRDQDDATYREYGRTSYSDAPTSPMVWFEPKVCQGWRIRIQRTAGADRDVTYQFFKEVQSA